VRIEDGAVDFPDERAGKRYQHAVPSRCVATVSTSGRLVSGSMHEGRMVIDEGKQDLQLALGTEMRVDLRAQSAG
jgi:hypothetical protein